MFFDVVRQEFGSLTQQQVDGFNVVLKASEGLPARWRAYMLATAWLETARTMQPVREAFWMSEGWRQTNLRYYPYYGRGYVQLTWKFNYEKAGKKLGVDLVNHPDKALEPDIAAKIMRYGMTEGWFTQHKLGDQSFKEMRKIINGTDRDELIAGYAETFLKALGETPPVVDVPTPEPYVPKKYTLWDFIYSLFTLIFRSKR